MGEPWAAKWERLRAATRRPYGRRGYINRRRFRLFVFLSATGERGSPQRDYNSIRKKSVAVSSNSFNGNR
jgi:hypothetical protein